MGYAIGHSIYRIIAENPRESIIRSVMEEHRDFQWYVPWEHFSRGATHEVPTDTCHAIPHMTMFPWANP